MKWAATPTDWYTDLGLDEAGERAEILHRRAWDFAGHQETGGFVPAAMVARLCPKGTKARVDALVRIGKWVEVDGGYQLAEWDDIYDELKSLLHRQKSDRERQRRHRAKQKNEESQPEKRDPERDENVDASRGLSRDSHGLEEKRDNPPTPRTAGGDCDLISKPHTGCRGCGTTKRHLAAAAAVEAAAADERRRAAAKNAPHCGHRDCDPISRWRTTDLGETRCPDCHELSILARTAPTQLELQAVSA